jgi:hypothetical protein
VFGNAVKKLCFADDGGNIKAITNDELMENDVATPRLSFV